MRGLTLDVFIGAPASVAYLDKKAAIHAECHDDGVNKKVIYDQGQGQWVCDDKDSSCANDGTCDNAGIHRACQYPQTPIF